VSGSFVRRPLAALAIALCSAAVLPATASAIVRPRTGPSADRSLQRYFDVRDATRTSVARAGAQSAQPASGRWLVARRSLRNRFGRESHLQLDAITGTPRSFQRLDGVLAGPASGSPAAVAMRYARANAAALGLSDADFDTLASTPEVRTSRTGITTVRWRQSFAGIPTYDNGLRVNLGRGNRVVSVQGAPVHDLHVSSVVPRLSAEQAMATLQRNVGVTRDLRVTSRSPGARRATSFSSGDEAKLVLFQLASGTRLAWSMTYRARSDAWIQAVVDATTGRVLRRANLTKFAVNVRVFDNYPGAPVGGTQTTFDMTPYLDSGQTQTLSGPFARTYLDVNDDNRPNAGEEVAPQPQTFQDFTATVGAAGFCEATAKCSWDPRNPLDRSSWQANKNHEAIQAHYYVSKYHDHLLNPAIHFNGDDGNFEDEDRVEVNANDGAATNAANRGPDSAHVDNANMSTPPDGGAPLMQMYLFRPLDDPTTTGIDVPFRAINGDDDADVVYHEYTHGLSNRLVVDDDGFGALNAPQSGAMGEAWSDWYAKDFLVDSGLQTDDPATDGDVFLGVYTDGVQPGLIRTEGLDCRPNSDPDTCPGGADADEDEQPDTGPGGYTYGDFGKVGGGPEVHADGEIWAQTLWDLRKAAGSARAEQLVTDGMRLSPAEPTFLDMRNAILAADEAVNGGANRTLIWSVFAARGMGFFAAAVDGSDTQPAEDFAMPPAPNGPKGTITGTVTDSTSGLPVEGQRVGIAGHTSDPAFGDYFAADTDANGNYSIPNVPAGTYPKLAFLPAAGFDLVVNRNVVVPAGGTAVQNAVARRDWSAASGGANVTTNDDTGSPFGCGVDPLIDQTLGGGWSAFQANAPATEGNTHFGTPPSATIELPQKVDVTAFGMDPGFTCGDDETATTRQYRVETSSDGVNFSTAIDGTRPDREFGVDDARRLNMLPPDAAGNDVKFVRLTLIEPVSENTGDSGAIFIDFSELEVFGGPKNQLPSGVLSANPGGTTIKQPVTLTAKFTDPDSKITGYGWDLDGNGSIDRTTAEPTTSTSYDRAGTFSPRVFAQDFRGGSGSATTSVLITARAPASKRPSLGLPRSGRKGRARFRVTCDSACLGSAKVTISRATARRLGLKSRTVGTRRFLFSRARTTRVTIKVSTSVLRKMRKAKMLRLKVRLRVSATDLEGQKRTASRTLRIRRN
jgi:extracellular elastinolytic metalloproteinase